MNSGKSLTSLATNKIVRQCNSCEISGTYYKLAKCQVTIQLLLFFGGKIKEGRLAGKTFYMCRLDITLYFTFILQSLGINIFSIILEQGWTIHSLFQ